MNHDLTPAYWNKRYQDGETGWDVGFVSTPLKNYFDQLTDKTISILIPGAGNAYEAEYLVNNGFNNVFVCDISAEAINNFKNRCPAFKHENLLLADFFELNHLHFDLIVEQTFFCALHPSLRGKYFEKMTSLLNPNGHLVGLLFDDKLNTDNPPFGGNMEEYRKYFENLFKVKTYESCYNSIAPRAGREIFINLEKV